MVLISSGDPSDCQHTTMCTPATTILHTLVVVLQVEEFVGVSSSLLINMGGCGDAVEAGRQGHVWLLSCTQGGESQRLQGYTISCDPLVGWAGTAEKGQGNVTVT